MASRGGFKLENQINEVGCNLFFQEPSHLGFSWDQQLASAEGFNFGLPPLLDYIEPFSMSSHHRQTMELTDYIEPRVEHNDFEEIADDFGLWDFDEPPPLIHNNIEDQNHNPTITIMQDNNDINNHPIIERHHQQDELEVSGQLPSTSAMQDSNDINNHPIIEHHHQQDEVEVLVELPSTSAITTNSYNMNLLDDVRRNGARYKSSSLKLEEIQRHFHLPITKAAKELNVDLTVLKKRCRELSIARWPHRKIKSLECLIQNVKEMGLTNEVEMLEEHKRMVETTPEMELTEKTKKLRQACFKANYKKRRSLLHHQAAALS